MDLSSPGEKVSTDIRMMLDPLFTLTSSIQETTVGKFPIESCRYLTSLLVSEIGVQGLHDRVQLHFPIPGVFAHSLIPLTPLTDGTSEPETGRGQLGRRIGHQGRMDQGDLREIKGDGTDMKACSLSPTSSKEEGKDMGNIELPVNGVQDVTLGLEELSLGVGMLTEM